MPTYKSLILLAFLSVFLVNGLYAQDENDWTLQQCIEYALDNNIQIKQQELQVQMGENRLTRARHNALPSLNASANHAYSFGRSTNFITNQKERMDIMSTSGSINTQLTLFQGFQLSNTRKQEVLNLQAVLSDVAQLKNDISLNIAAAYLQILFAYELVESAEMQLELSTMQVDRTQKLVDAGSLPFSNLMEMEAQRASDELQLVNMQNQLELSYITLIQLLDIRQEDDFVIHRPHLVGVEQELGLELSSRIYEETLNTMPQIRGAEYRVYSAERGVQIARGGQSPRVALGAGYGTGAQQRLRSDLIMSEDPFLDQIRDNANANVGISLSIPIFNGSQVRTSIADARINLEYSKLSLEHQKNLLYKEIQQAQADAVAAYNKYHATQKNMDALQEAFRHIEHRFSLGLANSLDYTTSKTRLAKAEADLLSAKFEYIFKLKILDFYKGIPLSI